MIKEHFNVGETVYFVSYLMVEGINDFRKFEIEEGKITKIENTTNDEQILTLDHWIRFCTGSINSFVSYDKGLVIEKSKEYARNIIQQLTEEFNQEKAKYEAIIGE